MARLSYEIRERVITLYSLGYSLLEICQRLREVNCPISVQVLYNLLCKFCEKGMVEDLWRRKRARKIAEKMQKLIEEELNKTDELTSSSICCG